MRLEIKIEDPQLAFNRVSQELREVGDIALGSGANSGDIKRYNQLHEQVRRKHPDGTIGHLGLKREIVIFTGEHELSFAIPSKKIPFRLKP